MQTIPRLLTQRRILAIPLFALIALSVLLCTRPSSAQSGTWESRAPMPQPVAVAAGADSGGQFYVFGSPGNSGVSVSQVYDPIVDSWSLRAADPIVRCAATAARISNKIYVAEGWRSAGLGFGCDSNLATTALEIYDPATDSPAARENFPDEFDFTVNANPNDIVDRVAAGELDDENAASLPPAARRIQLAVSARLRSQAYSDLSSQRMMPATFAPLALIRSNFAARTGSASGASTAYRCRVRSATIAAAWSRSSRGYWCRSWTWSRAPPSPPSCAALPQTGTGGTPQGPHGSPRTSRPCAFETRATPPW